MLQDASDVLKGAWNSGYRENKEVSCKIMNSFENLDSFGENLNVVIFGCTGGIGQALMHSLSQNPRTKSIFAISRAPNNYSTQKVTTLKADIGKEDDIIRAAKSIQSTVGELHLVLIATGILHDGDEIKPEKTWRALNPNSLAAVFSINAFGPAIIAKHFLPLLAHKRKSVFAALSARVGSIEDNRLGGWYAYRASKAALNMLIRTFSVELARLNPFALCVGLHPGTVDTLLSKPFQGSVSNSSLFSAERSANHLLNVVNDLGPEHSGRVFAWNGELIPF